MLHLEWTKHKKNSLWSSISVRRSLRSVLLQVVSFSVILVVFLGHCIPTWKTKTESETENFPGHRPAASQMSFGSWAPPPQATRGPPRWCPMKTEPASLWLVYHTLSHGTWGGTKINKAGCEFGGASLERTVWIFFLGQKQLESLFHNCLFIL